MEKIIPLLILFVVAISSCSFGNANVDLENAKETWKTEIKAEIPVGTNIDEVIKWFESKGYTPQPESLDEKTDYSVVLDSFKADEWYCEKWSIYVRINVSNDQKVSEYDVSSLGVCL
jgi:hypothetical protein